MRSNLFLSVAGLGLARLAATLNTATYTDPNTGIVFQQYENSDISYSFGIALPESPSSDFIGQLVVPISSTGGWGGVDLGPEMTGNLLIVAWANSDSVVSSLRQATGYSNPDVYSNSSVSALTIANGTFVNSSHVSYTFVCQGCGGTSSLDLTASAAAIGYAVSATDPSTLSDSSSTLTYHSVGADIFTVNLTAAQSSDYTTWASYGLASTTTTGSNSTTSSGSGSSNSTTLTPTTSNTTYDVIVVGGGASGIIAAERLAESGASVLLLERGPANTVALGSTLGLLWNSSLTPYDVPALGSSLTGISGVEFCSDTASTAGCVLGGSSSINGLNFIHPPQHDFERWPTGWSWTDMSSAANRLYERNPGTTQPSADGIHYDELAYTVLSSYLGGQGWSEVDSIQSPDSKYQVYSRPAWSISDHMRAGPARTYMPFAEALDTFNLQLNTKVIQVLRNGSTITGVLTESSDGTSSQIINLNTNGKVVLAGGALSTPRVLWNSGIGRSDALAIVANGTSGVTLPDQADWIDLPVGHSMMDHAQVPLKFTTTPGFTAVDFSGLATSPNTTDLDLYESGDGVITQAAQRMHLWTSINGTDGRTRYFQGTVSAMADNTVTVKAFLTHGTSSTGELGISSSGNTIINTKPWLSDDADMEGFTEFLQFLMDLNSTSSTSTNATNATSTTSMAYSTSGATPSDVISSLLVSGDHWVGTARMGTDDGRESNGTSVVDTDTRVYGTDNLFVVDASIHPDLPTGNTQAIIMVVAEHAAEKIAAYNVTNWNADTTTSAGSSTSGSIVTVGSNSTTAATTSAASSSSTSGSTTKCRRRREVMVVHPDEESY